MPEGFTFNGIHSSTHGLAVLKVEDPLMPPIKDKKEEIPGRDGAWDFGFDYGPRAISIDVALTAQARSNLKATIRQIAGWLSPKTGTKELRFDDEPDKYYLARLVGNISIDYLISAYTEFTITFVAYDPMAYGEEIVWQDIVDTGVFVVNNPGTYDIRPVITITALSGGMPGDVNLTGGYDPAATVNDTLTDLILTINGKIIQYVGIILPGQSLIIDCVKMQVTLNSLNAIQNISGEFPVLGPGNNNLTMTDSTSTGGGSVKIQYQGRWL